MPPRPRSALPDLVLAHQVGRIFHAKTHGQTSFTFAAQENLCFVPLAFLNADEAFDEAGYAAVAGADTKPARKGPHHETQGIGLDRRSDKDDGRASDSRQDLMIKDR